MYMHVGDANGQLTTRVLNPAVCADLLKQVHGWVESGATTDDVVGRLKSANSTHWLHFSYMGKRYF